jgi:hypothetical protein
MIGVRISTRNLDRFSEAARRIEDFSAPNAEIAIELYRWMLRNYDSGGAYVGGWAPLSPRTAAYKARRGWSTVPLGPRTGTLRAGFQYESTRARATAYNPVEYSRYHQNGAPSRNLPRRPLLPEQAVVGRLAQRVYTRHVERHMRGER